MITKIYFPRSVIPISMVFSKFVNFIISIAIAVVVIIIAGHHVEPVAFLMLPMAMLILLVFCLGMALILSAANVYMRDVQYLVSVPTMVWIWLTPIMYVRNYVDNELISTLLSLEDRQFYSGFAEVMKSALIKDAPF